MNGTPSWGCSTGAAAAPRTARHRGPRPSGSCSSIAPATRSSSPPLPPHLPADHGATLSYTFVRLALQPPVDAQGRARGRHRRRREPRACFGELLHLDGAITSGWPAVLGSSDAPHRARRCHQAATLCPALARGDHARRAGSPTRRPRQLRVAHVAVHRPAGWPSTRPRRAARWIAPTSPSSGGSWPAWHRAHPELLPPSPRPVERLNRTLQGRLINELRVAGLTTLAAANAYLREHYLADYNEEFTRPPTDPASAFVPLGDVDLDQLLAEDGARLVGRDNVVSFEASACKSPSSRAAELRGTARHRAAPPDRGAHRLARPAMPGPHHAQGRPLDGPRPRLPKPLQPRPRPLRASRPKNAHAHLASEARPTRPPRSHHSPSRPFLAAARSPASHRPSLSDR